MTKCDDRGHLTASRAMRGVTVLLLAGLVSACSSTGGSTTAGGDGEDITLADFDTAFADAQGRVPTSDMRGSGAATYTGAVQMDLVDQSSAPVGAVIGDLSLSVDFDQNLQLGQPDNFQNAAVTGTISNITGQTTSGDTIDWSGDLTTDNGLSTSIVAIVTTTFPAPGVGEVTTRTGSLGAYFGGPVSVTSDQLTYEGDAYVVLSGSFTGSGGTGVWGQSQGFLTPDGAPSANNILAEFSGQGGFVASEQ
ncbi:hypothetical protein [Flavimaricola marinus]|uniref:Transferrin-binding protein B C-lobe/N-lobe beta barrel domain-containing protein n=1 Tax=Flavimaricola marinus TaxID=1819565 RepID=A0A238LJ44_9RHOB|nr:hypothetical protein [Flavimaricola marinus]SMY09671.1 hypothetical protein LOM8899_03843 [Flavimaricola marinus]